MTFEIVLMLSLIAAALIFFALELLPLEVTAMALMGTLLLTGLITVDQVLEGLSNKAVVTVGALFVLSYGLAKSGILEVAADRVSHAMERQKTIGLSILLAIAALSSGFLNNTAVVALLIPLTIDLCRRLQISPSKLLIPLSYASILGGMLTLIGTSTNLLVSALAEDAGQPPLRMFEFTLLGFIFLIVGLVYILFLSVRFLPARAEVASLTSKYRMGAYLTELRVLDSSGLVGMEIKQAGINQKYDITVLAVIRAGQRLTEDLRNIALRSGDILICRGFVDNFLRMRNEQQLALLSDVKLSDQDLEMEGQVMAEALVSQNSRLIGRTLAQADFRQHYGAFVLAIRHHAQILREKVAHIPLQFSDTLLLMAPRERLEELRKSEDLLVISELDLRLRRSRFWWVAVLLLPVIVILSALGVMEILKGAILGAILLLILRAIEPREAYRAVNWSVLFLIASFVPVGMAMEKTGTAGFIATSILSVVDVFPSEFKAIAALSLLYLATSLLTEVVSNNATAIIVTPISMSLAASLGVDPRAFIITVCFAASASFMTPTGYQTNLMVFGPGSYRYLDFVRFGAPLNVIYWILATLLIPYFWPLH